MAWTNIKLADVSSVEKVFAYEFNETLASPGNGASVILPANIRGVSVTLGVTAGSGKVQATTSTIFEVKNDTALWIDWDYGVVSANSQDFMLPATAVRQINISGTTKLELRAQ